MIHHIHSWHFRHYWHHWYAMHLSWILIIFHKTWSEIWIERIKHATGLLHTHMHTMHLFTCSTPLILISKGMIRATTIIICLISNTINKRI
jgi:hypothetical protein